MTRPLMSDRASPVTWAHQAGRSAPLANSMIRQTNTNTPNRPWAKVDLPLGPRTAESALFAMNKMLVEWGYSKREVEVDTATHTLKLAGEEIVTRSSRRCCTVLHRHSRR